MVHRIGFNLNISKGLLSSVKYAKELEINFYQIFLSNPQSYNAIAFDKSTLNEFKLLLEKNDIKVVIHSQYLINFCNETNSEKYKKSVKCLIDDIKAANLIGAIGVVVHMGRACELDKSTAFNNYVTGIKKVLSQVSKGVIILETGAGIKSEICSSLFGLYRLFNSFTTKEKERIKICIDTCHVFSYGYNLNDTEYVSYFCNMIETLFSWKNIACIHLNDSKKELNSKKDRHQDIGKGYVGENGLKEFTKICLSNAIPIVLETPCKILSKTEQLKIVKSWI